MDIFIDKFAQRKNAQELIKANYMAEAEENERLSAQVAVCEETLQEVHKVSLQNLANAEKTGQVLDAAMKKILEVQKTDPDAEKKVLDEISEMKTALEEMKTEVSEISEMKMLLETGMQEQDRKFTEALDGWNSRIEAMFKNAEDFNHKEAVKVYRNVQAVLEEQLAKQSQETTEKMTCLMEQKKFGKGILPVCILTFAAVLVNITIVVLQLLGII